MQEGTMLGISPTRARSEQTHRDIAVTLLDFRQFELLESMMFLACFIFGMVSSLLSGSVRCAPLQSMEKPLELLRQHFNINHPEVAEGGAKFTKILLNYKSQSRESGIVLTGIARWYLDLFANIVKTHQHDEIKQQIEKVANGLQEWLQSDKYNATGLLNDLSELKNIKWDDQLVQRKAILELQILLQKMDAIGKRRRKRNMGRQRT
ncbi:interferon gamma-like [Heptranchias perlo]|uniref:interferon gamma-like n=1 Tax=Heptranchias perlo TaxID=212740 RepID=UPI003559EF2B